MMYVVSIVACVAFYTSVYAHNKIDYIVERRKTMNTMQWLDNLKQGNKTGQLTTSDDRGSVCRVQWERVDGKSPRITEITRSCSSILIPIYTAMELAFARQHPELVAQEMFLKPLAPLFEHGIAPVDWHRAHAQLTDVFTAFFANTDFGQFSGDDDVQFFIRAYDATNNELLGLIHLVITSAMEYGAVKVSFYGVAETAKNRGLEKMLMSSIFAIVPNVTRIFLHTRVTNTHALEMYQSWGFKPFAGPLPYWADVEYNADQADALQQLASKTFVK